MVFVCSLEEGVVVVGMTRVTGLGSSWKTGWREQKKVLESGNSLPRVSRSGPK